MNRPILLIGPMATGKSTIAALLAEKLGVPHIELDERRWDYYKEIGYDEVYAQQLREAQGFNAMYRYWKPFEIHAVERVLADCTDGVISFGAGHSVYEDEVLLERAQRALAPYKNVILLLPSADLQESARVLLARFLEQVQIEGFTPNPELTEMIDHMLQHPSNGLLAKLVVYSAGKTPQETCQEILQRLQL